MGKNKQGKNYDWPKWLKVGSSFTLRRGKDYESTDRTMAAYIYRMARQRKVKVVVSQLKDGVIKIITHMGKLDGRSA